jgi:hypothetical protein
MVEIKTTASFGTNNAMAEVLSKNNSKDENGIF